MTDTLADRLEHAGMSADEAAAKEAMFAQILQALRELSGGSVDRVHSWFVPGRIEFLGKHTDYAGGRSVLCTAGRGFCVAARARKDARVRMIDAGTGSRAEFALDAGPPAIDLSWTKYVNAVARRIARNFPAAGTGADIAFASDLPQAAGMSSSSALIVATFLALCEVNALDRSEEYRREIRNREDLAGYLACVENGQSFRSLAGDSGVGTFGGSEDHTAVLCCRAGQLSLYRFCPVRHEADVSFPGGHVLAVAASGVVAEKTGAARELYNRASLAARRILEIWRASSGRNDATLAAALAVPGAPERIRQAITATEAGPAFLDRFEQFLAESEIIPAAVDALSRCDLSCLGVLVERSQSAAERLLRNQVPETIALARFAREFGAAAASAFGAGFGGSVWALVPGPGAQEFITRWSDRYRKDFPAAAGRASFFITRPGPPAMRLQGERSAVWTRTS